MTYQQTLDYLYSQLPMYQRNGPVAYKPDLNNTLAICKLVGNPQNKFKTVHIAGTNGKGSTSHMLAAVLQAAGYKVGLYTSPHLKDFRERIRINGKMIPKSVVTRFIKKHKTAIDKIQPSFFETTIGLAFDYFAKEKIDIGIIETGLGGRLDATNIITPELSLITNIGLDHTDILGDTLEKIALEKAGIIKPGIPIIISETQQEIQAVFMRKAKEKKAALFFADSVFEVKHVNENLPSTRFQTVAVFHDNILIYKKLKVDLGGRYQLKNIGGVMQALEILKEKGFEVQTKHVKSGLQHITKSTGLLGRWQILNKKPLIICDTGHNAEGIARVVEQLKATPHKDLHIVFGVVKEKDPSKVLRLLPKKAHCYFCKADIPRALDQQILANAASKLKLKGKAYGSVAEAFAHAKQRAHEQDLIFVGGSTFVVAEVL